MESGVTSDSLEFQNSRAPNGVSGDVAFSALRESHREALDARPNEVSTARFILAGATVSMTIAGRHLATLIGKPFRHLSTRDLLEPPHLTIDLWDELATGIACPRAVRDVEERAEKGGEADSVVTVGTAADRYVGHLRPGIRVWTDRQAAHIVGWVESSARLSIQDRGKPLHFPLLLWHADRGVPVIHAALVASRGQGALLVGKGGTGKTTAALACFLGGLDFLGDDYVGLQRAGGRLFVGHSLYSSVWLTADGESRFRALIPYAEPPERPDTGVRRLVQVFDVAPDRLKPTAQIRAVVATVLSAESASSFRPVSKATTLLALAPTSMLRLPVSGTVHLEWMSQLVGHVPCYELAVGRDVSTLPPLVRTLLEQGERR